MKENANKALVREFFASIDKGDLDKVKDLLTTDCAIHAPALSKPWGVEDVLQDIRRFYTAFPGGKYTIIWRRQGDGKWKSILDMWNRDAPATRETT